MKRMKRCPPVIVLAIAVGVLAIARERRIATLEAEFAARSQA
jgi:hypothetical protein